MKLAQLCFVARNLATQRSSGELKDAAASCVDKLEQLMTAFVDGKWANSLAFDTSSWGLVAGKLGLADDSDETRGIDFMAGLGNDQHYHFGYIIHATVALVELQPDWLSDHPAAVPTINALIRSTVNPSHKHDRYFPAMRIFDLYSGHAWSSGIVVAADGKDEESTSEAQQFYYAVSQWGPSD